MNYPVPAAMYSRDSHTQGRDMTAPPGLRNVRRRSRCRMDSGMRSPSCPPHGAAIGSRGRPTVEREHNIAIPSGRPKLVHARGYLSPVLPAVKRGR